MPEACVDFEQKCQKPRLDEITVISYESLNSKAQSYRNRSGSTDANYKPLNERQYVRTSVEDFTPGVSVCRSHSTLAETNRAALCSCCNCKDNSSCCWRTKRKQIIWESAHASAKNRKAIIPAATTTTNPTTTATASLLPTALTTRSKQRNSISSSSSSSVTLPAIARQSNSNKKQQQQQDYSGNNISTSLPTTPNLSQLRRPQRATYKKLSLQYAAADHREKQQQQQQQHAALTCSNSRQQLPMSAATNLQRYTHKMILKPERSSDSKLQVIPAIATTTITTAAATNTIKTTTAEAYAEQLAAKNNNNETVHKVATATHFEPTTTTTTAATDSDTEPYTSTERETSTSVATISTETQTDLAMLSHVGGSTTTKTTAANNVNAAAAAAAVGSVSVKSSLTFCEQCCCAATVESASLRSSNNAHGTIKPMTISNSGNNNNNNSLLAASGEDYGRYYCAASDSVSDLSSFRIVSDEEDTKSACVVLPQQQQQQQQKQTEFINAIERAHVVAHPTPSRLPCHFQCRAPSAELSTDKHSATTNTNAPSQCSTRASPTICCYKIDNSSAAGVVHYSASAVLQHTSSAPVPIPQSPGSSSPTAVGHRYRYETPEVIVSSVSNNFTADYLSQLSTSLPKDYGRVSYVAQRPPPVPPKPRACNSSCSGYKPPYGAERERSSKRSAPYPRTRLERGYYDPDSFQRKLQKFEQQQTLISPAHCTHSVPPAACTVGYATLQCNLKAVPTYDSSRPLPRLHIVATSQERSLSPAHCELLNCFGALKNISVKAAELPSTEPAEVEILEGEQAVRDFVTRSLSDSSCCSTLATNAHIEKCNQRNTEQQQNQQHYNNNNNNNTCENGSINKCYRTVSPTANARASLERNNNNYNYKTKKSGNPLLGQPAELPQRTLRYDSYGRLKPERVSHLPTARGKSASETRLNREQQLAQQPSQQQQQQHQQHKVAAIIKSEPLAPKVSVVNSSAVQRLTPTLCRKLNFVRETEVNLRENEVEKVIENKKNSIGDLYSNNNANHNNNNNNKYEKISSVSLACSASIYAPRSELDLSRHTKSSRSQQQQQQQQLFKSYSDNNNFLGHAKPPIDKKNATNSSSCSDFPLKYQHTSSYSSLPGKCSCKQSTTAISPTTPTSPISPISPTSPISLNASICLHGLNHKNSHSLPSVSQSHDTQPDPVWLSTDTIPSSRCSEHKCLEDVQSNCSDQTTIFHLDNDCSLSASSSSPSTQSLGQLLQRGPLILKRIPAIQSFGYIPTHSSSLGSANVRENGEKEASMEKRRNTLDRFQRLAFGRKTSPSAAATQQQQAEASGSTRNRKSSEKSERLKELTELLRGNRSSPTPPPVPPPRKPRNGSHSASSSFERADTQAGSAAARTATVAASSVDSAQLSFMSTHSDDIMLMDQDEQAASDTGRTATATAANLQRQSGGSSATATAPTATAPTSPTSPLPSPSAMTTRLYDTLKPNTSLSNFESLMLLGREKSKSPPPITEVDTELAAAGSTDIATKLARPESRTIIGSYTQKGIPYRSASFSQIDSKSGKFKKSALSALRDRLRRDKAVDATSATNATAVAVSGGANAQAAKSKGGIAEEPVAKATSEPQWIHIPLKKTELSINLNYGQEVKNLEDVMESPEALPEDDIFSADIQPTAMVTEENRQALANQIVVAHAKMESLTDTIHSENDYTIDEEQLPLTVGSEHMTASSAEPAAATATPTLELGTPNIATLMEEQIPLESPPDNFLQTATTCLIPVPVYECAAQEWSLENPPHEWVEVAPEEFGIVPETIEPLIALEQCAIAKAEAKTQPEQRSDIVPTISVSRSSEEADDAAILRKKENVAAADTEPVERRQASLDQPEVRKRYSHDDMEIGTEKRCSLDGIATRHSADERKRIDKSRRRKGMYIENADWSDTHVGAPHGRGLALDISIANFNAIKPDSPEDCNIMYINSPATEENPTPASLYSFDLNTPESECSKPPVWTKATNLANFSCQSSEEKDDAPHSNAIGGGAAGKRVGLPRNNKSYPILRTDSVSDGESDRTPPSSRDRTSPNPTASDYDCRRFSKRPLRGPYGQMLEAEMKKPNKMHFEEILEDLRESEGTTQPRRQRGAHNDDASGRSNMPQYSNSMRVRKTSTYLPVPAHARAASTPSQIENANKGGGVGDIDKINPHEKRYQSSLDTTAMREKEYSLEDAVAAHSSSQQQTQPPQQPQQVHPSSHQRDMKRAASEAPAPKSHHSKRSQSMSSSDKAAHSPGSNPHAHQQKRSLDVSSASDGKGSKGATVSMPNTPATTTATTATTGPMPTQQLLAELLKGSSEKLLSEQRQQMFADTRTHVVQEIFRNEQSYVESLQTVVLKYLKALKLPEHAGMIDTRTVDEIFFMVPDILEIHQKFLAELKARLDNWDSQQKVGDAFLETFSKLEVLEVYTSFVNNCNRAKNAIRTTKHQRPSFAKFLETTAREHKGKLTLDNLLIKPVQKFPNYEMLFQRLIKHTDHDHPDQKHLQDVLKLVHDILVHINCKEREILENGQREATLRELEGVIEGITELIAPDRQFLLFDLVSMPSGQGARKERGFFLFNDLLVLTSIKKRSGTIRKPNTSTCPGTVASTLDTNKYKFLTKISLDCLEIVKTKDENVKRIMNEIENLADDCNKLTQIAEITASLKYPHQYLEDVIRELLRDVQRQLSERQTNDAQLNMLELMVNSPNGSQKLSIVFSKAEKRAQWEETFNEAKLKLAATLERHPIPEFLTSIPIRKTRAGLQFTCAAATLSEKRDVWVCNSDGYVGQVCIMSLHPEPNVTSCNGVCNARILCVASVPAFSGSTCSSGSAGSSSTLAEVQRTPVPPHHSYTQQLREYRKSISPNCQTAAASIGSAESLKKKAHVGGSTTAAAAAAGNTSAAGTINNNNNSDTQLDLNLSSSDDEADATGSAAAAAAATVGSTGSGGCSVERVPSPAPSIHTMSSTNSGCASAASTAVAGSTGGGSSYHSHQDSNPEEGDGNQSTMWIGTEDGCIHVYNSTDNIRIKKNRIKIEHHSAVYSILYLDNRVFVSLANGDICVYLRDGAAWNTSSSHCISIGTVTSPVTKLLSVHGKLWCSIQGIIKVLDIETLSVVNQIQISSDSKPITNMTVANNYVWISIQNSAHIKCFHSNSHQLITEVNLAPAVNKMLSNCDEIIRQHKAACLRVTSLLSCKDLIWIGTSAGVLLTIPAQGYDKSGAANVVPTGIPHGHTGHVRFLTFVETTGMSAESSSNTSMSSVAKESSDSASTNEYRHQGSTKHTKTKNETNNILIISGGDGYEDFRNSGANSLSEIAGREDSTNHLLIWQI